MADQFDRAQELEQLAQQHALAEQRLKASRTAHLVPTGECQNPLCCEPLEGPQQLFCGPACAAEHGKRVK